MSIAELDVTQSHPDRRRSGSNTGAAYRLTYDRPNEELKLPVAASAPPELQVTLEIGQEGEAWWARIPELDVTGDGDDLRQALAAVYGAAREWLTYLRDEQPRLAGARLAIQRRHVALLNAPGTSWFKDVGRAD